MMGDVSAFVHKAVEVLNRVESPAEVWRSTLESPEEIDLRYISDVGG